MDPRNRRLTTAPKRPLPRKAGPGTAAARLAAPAIEPGTEIGDFLVVRELGRGVSGATFEARQRSRDRLVALKVLDPSLSGSPQAVTRFRAEAALAARVSHPGIVPLVSVGSRDRFEFYAMGLAHGPSLAEFIEGAVGTRGEMFFRETALRFAGLAAAVETLHQAGIVHRKIAPQNLHLEGDRLVLTDFELAVEIEQGAVRPEDHFPDSPPTRSRLYLAPEEFLRGAPVDPRSDIYSLGLSLYELATGILPFPRCAEEDLARLKLTRLPIAPRRLNPDLPLGLEAVIREAIEASPALRHPSAGALARDLARFAEKKRGPTRRHGARPEDEPGTGGEPLADPAPVL